MNRNKKIYLAFVFCLTAVLGARAQEKKQEQRVDDAQFEIVKTRKNRVGEAERRFEKIPPQSNLEVEKPELRYSLRDFRVELPDFKPHFRVLKMKKQKSKTALSNYVKAGFGNYISPMAEFFVGSSQGGALTWGLHGSSFFSLSGPKDDDFSAEDRQGLAANLIWTKASVKIDNRFSFKRRGLHYYGYDSKENLDKNDIRQSYNDFSYRAVIASQDLSDWKFRAAVEPYFFNNAQDTQELGVRSELQLNSDWGSDWEFALDMKLHYTSFESWGESEGRSFLDLKPAAVFETGDWTFTGALRFVYQSDTAAVLSPVQLFPVVDFGYELNEQYRFHFGLDGGATYNTFRALTYRNPFVTTSPAVQNSIQDYKVYGKVAAFPLRGLQLQAGLDYGLCTNLPYFVNDFAGKKPQEFLALYDDSQTKIFHLFFEADYVFQNSLQLGLSTDYNAYDPDALVALWSYPVHKTTAFAAFNAGKKVNLRIAGEMLGGIQALDEQGAPVTLDAITDLSLKGTYLVNENIRAFLNLDNILGQENPYFYRYPTKGFQFLLGAQYSF